MMVGYGLVLTIIEDGTEAQFSGSGRVHAFTGKQVNAGGTWLVWCWLSLLLGIYIKSLTVVCQLSILLSSLKSAVLHFDKYLKSQLFELLCSMHSFCVFWDSMWESNSADEVLHTLSDTDRKLDIMEVVAAVVQFLTLISPLSAKIDTKWGNKIPVSVKSIWNFAVLSFP